ncbi:MAG: hypothetical protein FWE80_08985 [Oscillospiraceae bacterium]|nr:hypothetical protein [Oscillospiraceae bacterium]
MNTAYNSEPTTGSLAAKVFGMTFFAAILCFFLNMSVLLLFQYAFTTRIGTCWEGEDKEGRTIRIEHLDQFDAQGEYIGIKADVYDISGKEKVWLYGAEFTADELEEMKQAAGTTTVATGGTTAAAGETTDAPDRAEGPAAAEDPAVTEAPASAATKVQDRLPAIELRNEIRMGINSEMSAGRKLASGLIAQTGMLILFVAFPYNIVWDAGNRDQNQVHFKRKKADPRRGVVIGLLASIPAGLMFGVMVFAKISGSPENFVDFWRTFNVCFFPYFNEVIPGDIPSAQIPWSGIAAMLPVLLSLPVITHLGYTLGFKDFSIIEKVVYKTTGKKLKRKKKN